MTDNNWKSYAYVRARTRNVSENRLSSVIRHRCHHLQACMNLLCITLHDDIATRIGTAYLLVALIHEGTADVHRAELLRGAAADDLQGACHRHILALLVLLRLSEVDIHQLRLQSWCLELAVVLGQSHDLRLREPVAEALAVEPVRLTVDALVVEGVLARREDAIDLEGQPAP